MAISAGYVATKTAYEITPIILTRGIATSVGGYLPIVALTQLGFGSGLGIAGAAVSAIATLATGGNPLNLNNFFANFQPMAGATLINNQIATYPFANQAVAANAIITQPLAISMVMYCPVRETLGYATKLAIMISLQNTLSQHNISGGTYSVVTPSYIYTDCIMTGMRAIDGGDSKQVQYAWQLDFSQPLVSTQAAATAQNSLMQSLANGTPVGGTPAQAPTGLPVGAPSPLTAIYPPGSGL